MAYPIQISSQISLFNKKLKKELVELEDYVYDAYHQLEQMKRSQLFEILDTHAQWKEYIEENSSKDDLVVRPTTSSELLLQLPLLI